MGCARRSAGSSDEKHRRSKIQHTECTTSRDIEGPGILQTSRGLSHVCIIFRNLPKAFLILLSRNLEVIRQAIALQPNGSKKPAIKGVIRKLGKPRVETTKILEYSKQTQDYFQRFMV